MISYTKSIVNSKTPLMMRSMSFECDWCGCRCIPEGNWKEKLYQYEEDQLCAECVLEALENAGIIERVTE